jgi:hypothetical protein
MRRNLMALGILVIFLAFVVEGFSRTPVEVEAAYDTWVNVNSKEANPPEPTLSVEGNLVAGDKFRIFFQVQPSSSNVYLPDSLGIKINLSDTNGNVLHSYFVEAEYQEEKIVLLNSYPVVTANDTEIYNVVAQPTGNLLMRLLVIQKSQHVEAKVDYPFEFLSLASIIVFLVGVGFLLWGAKSSKHKTLRKERSSKRA